MLMLCFQKAQKERVKLTNTLSLSLTLSRFPETSRYNLKYGLKRLYSQFLMSQITLLYLRKQFRPISYFSFTFQIQNP